MAEANGPFPLSNYHLEMLREESGISDEMIAARGYRTITDDKELIAFRFAPKQVHVPGLLLPLHTTDGTRLDCVYRPDDPRVESGKARKYEFLPGRGIRLDCPPVCQEQLKDPKIPLWITEGQKKADALASCGACAIALLGVWNFKGKNDFGGVAFLTDWDYIALNNRGVRIVFDNAAQPLAELVDDAPLTIRRPLALIDGRAYAAIWPYVKLTVRETLDKSGQVIKVNPPRTEVKQRLLIVRNDGRVFGDGGDEPLSGLGLNVHLPEIPPVEKLWSTPAVKICRSGVRPDPVDVFTRIVDIVNTFIDFDRSLADQRTMCEMVACYSIATYFLDAFTVAGFLWPNGERGSGKTQLLLVVTELAYLGQTILAGGSFASLRDLADYGACLAFDDAENLSDPKRTDPDKRALLLAGNRKGSTIPLKEPGPDRTWKTRHVNTFSFRLFSAIRLPDAVLASRSIVVPLIRTINRAKANADPLDYKLWPHDRRKLIDDLWALGLTHLSTLSHYETLVNDRATLSGRTLEPWRAVLAVALWLDDAGVKGLFARMETLSQDYQRERPEMETGDLTALVIRALCRVAVTAVSSVTAVNNGHSQQWTCKTKDLFDAAKAIIVEAELDLDPERINSRRIGRVLAKMRLRQEPRPKGQVERQWLMSASDVKRWAELYSLSDWLPSKVNGSNGANGSNGDSDDNQEESSDLEQEEEGHLQSEVHANPSEPEHENAEEAEWQR